MVRLAAAFAVLCIGIAVVFFRNDIADSFIEGEYDARYVEAGRYEGTWRFEGDPEELDDFARGLERIEFRIEDPPPGSWRGMEPPRGPEFFTKDDLTSTRGRGICLVDGQEYPFRLIQKNPHQDEFGLTDGWLQFEQALPFLTGRSWGDGFEISLEAMRNPENDWLSLWFGHNLDGSTWGLPYTRVN